MKKNSKYFAKHKLRQTTLVNKKSAKNICLKYKMNMNIIRINVYFKKDILIGVFQMHLKKFIQRFQTHT